MTRSTLHLGILTLLSYLSETARAQYGGDDNPPKPNPSPTTSAANATSTPGSDQAGGLTGGSHCSVFMCVAVIVNGSRMTYELQSLSNQMKWMAVGFGTGMIGSPMVIMWPNADNTITLSQREANDHVMPTPVSSPARVATVATPLSTLDGDKKKLTFTIDASSTSSSHIYAFGADAPSSSDPSATLRQHLDYGDASIDLTKPISSPFPTAPGQSSGSDHLPLLPYQKTIIAHAIVTTFGFLFILPLGALLARFTRTYSSAWFKGHWILQGTFGGVAIVLGCILGFVAVQQHGTHILTRHKSLGIALLILYTAQVSLGILIHSVKIAFRAGRPPQNYAHAILGLVIIALAIYQVRLGYDQEWPSMTGRGSVDMGIGIAWIIWAIVLPLLYFGGLAYLPRQLRQERGARDKPEYVKLIQRGYS